MVFRLLETEFCENASGILSELYKTETFTENRVFQIQQRLGSRRDSNPGVYVTRPWVLHCPTVLLSVGKALVHFLPVADLMMLTI